MINILRFLKTFFKSLLLSSHSFNANEGFEHAGYLSYLLMLALFPFMVLLVSIISLIGEKRLSLLFLDIILSHDVEIFLASLREQIIEIITSPPQGLLTFVALSALWTSSSMLEAIKTTLNKAYRVHSPPRYLLRRFVSIIEFMLMLTFILTTLAIMFLAPLFLEYLSDLLHLNQDTNLLLTFIHDKSIIIRSIFLTIFGFLLVMWLYHYIPNRKKPRLSTAAPGALLVILGWLGSAYLFRFYIEYFTQLNIIYGGIAGIIITLIFFYICSMVFIFGAEFNYNLSKNLKCKHVS